MFRVYGLGLSSSFDRLRRCFGGFVVLQGSTGLPSGFGYACGSNNLLR